MDRMARVAPPVVAIDRGGEPRVVIAVDMDRRVQRQAHADEAALGRIAEAQPGHRKHLVGQFENLTDHVNVVAQYTDRARAEPQCFRRERTGLQGERGIDRGVEEPFERAVRLFVAAQVADPLKPARVAEKQQKHRRGTDPRHVGKQRGDSVAPAAVPEPDRRGLLTIGFRGGREGGLQVSPIPAGADIMPDSLTTNSPIIAAYRAATPGSAARAERAAELFPSGITHDSRYIEPYGLYIARAQGPRKWDVDGRCYVDYIGGHGALLLGHCHPEVMAAVHAQLDRGTHYGASHELEIDWAERVKALIPTAERVRFTSSGTEATLMAVRLARAFTGKPKLIRFTNHFDGTPTTGVLDAVAGNILLCDQNDEAALARLLEQHKGEVAAAIIEPT